MDRVLPKCSGLMVNPYYVRQKYSKMFDLGQTLRFRGTVFCDSGGFQLSTKSLLSRKNPVKRYTQDQVLLDQIGLGSDYAAALDFPLDPNASERANMARISKSLANVERAVNLVQTLKTKATIVPVVHGYNRGMMRFVFQRLERLEKELSYAFPLIAVGSLVPLYADRSNLGSLRLVHAFQALLEFVPNHRAIHVMGAGSPLSMRFYYWLGAQSLDTRSWVTNAMFGKIVMPGSQGGRIHTSKLIAKFGPKANICNCPSCKNSNLRNLSMSRMKRAAHNAFTYLREFKKIRRELRAGTFEENTVRLLKKRVFFRRIIKVGSLSK